MEGMVAAMGGEVWLQRKTWVVEGRVARFYKGLPDGGTQLFEEFGRREPFGLRVVEVSRFGGAVMKDRRDVAQVWTADAGWEMTYKGTRAMGAKEVEDFERVRGHSVEAVVGWLGEAGTVVSYEGRKLVESELVDEVSVLGAGGDAVTVRLDAGTHLPVSVSWRWRDMEFKDWNTDAVEYADWHAVQGIETPYAVTMRHNGDVAGERFVMKVVYGGTLPARVFGVGTR